MSKVRWPRSRAEWQEAADAAQGALELDSCRQYGLIEGGPKFDLKRARQILRRAAAHGIRPGVDCGVRLVGAINAESKVKVVPRPRPV